MIKKYTLEVAAKKGYEVFIALKNGHTFIAKIKSIEDDGHVMFNEITGFDGKIAILIVHLSDIVAMGKLKPSEDDESAFKVTG